MSTVTSTSLRRLAETARARGLRLLHEPLSNQWFVTSASDPGKLYRVTAVSCTCLGFQTWQRCTHHALLLAEKGWLPNDDPEPPASPVALFPSRRSTVRVVTCSMCEGTGHEEAGLACSRTAPVSCWMCGGIGHVERPGDPPVAEQQAA